MIQAIALFPSTTDLKKFENILTEMVSSLRKSKGFLSIHVSDSHIMSPGGPPPYSKVVQFTFDSLENMMNWAQSPAAQSQKESMRKYNSTMLFYEVKELQN
jgi:heme-degrading monooxygenase HmoA